MALAVAPRSGDGEEKYRNRRIRCCGFPVTPCGGKTSEALLAARGEEIPYIHYLEALARKLTLGEEVFTDILEISADYIISRYPDLSESAPFEQYSTQIAQEKIVAARRIFTRLEPEYKSILEDT